MNGFESFKLIQFTVFFISWKSHVVLDPSKQQISSLELKVSSTTKINRVVRKVLDSPHLDFQDTDSEVIRESLGMRLQAHFAVCYKFCLYIMQTHTQEANLTVMVHGANAALKKDLDFFRSLTYPSWLLVTWFFLLCILTTS